MSKYFIDAEFLEGTQKKWYGKTPPTIDLISIGIVAEDGREYYAISKDFNLKEAWNRYDIKTMSNLKGDSDTNKMKVYWIRDNVLKPIFDELYILQYKESCKLGAEVSLLLNGFEKKNNLSPDSTNHVKFTYNNLRTLINKYGKTNKQIAQDIIKFVGYKEEDKWLRNSKEGNYITEITSEFNKNGISFYGYYCDYDWVVFCWLFGKMIDLPTGFPMRCIDLKQLLDDKVSNMEFRKQKSGDINDYEVVKGSTNLQQFLDLVKGEGLVNGTYPKQTNEHNALADARFNRDLFNFLNTI